MAYEVHLSQFEGPLDLLLHLIEQAKVDIKDIFISEITAQYLALMGEVDELDMDTASACIHKVSFAFAPPAAGRPRGRRGS